MPTDSKERKDVPLYSGCLAYFPLALAEVARLSQAGNDKHNPGEPLHWSRGKSNVHTDCIARHVLVCGQVDGEGFLHDVKVAWRALANLQIALEADGVALYTQGHTWCYEDAAPWASNPEAMPNPYVQAPVCSPCVAEPWARAKGTSLPNPKKHKDIYDDCLERGNGGKDEDADDYCRVCLERKDRCMCHAEGYNGA